LSLQATWTSFRFAIEYAAFRAAGLLFGSMKLEMASRVSGTLWRHLAPYSSRHGRALAHLARAFPEKTDAEREAIIRAMWENLGRTFGESFHLREIASSGRVTYENKEVLERWAAAPGGKVACAGHLGNWELAILGIMQQGAKPWSIYRPMKNPLVDAEIFRMRKFLYTGGLVPKNPSLPRQFMRLVREGATVGFLSDQRDNNGVIVSLFGRAAPSTIFPALLARSVKAPILMVRMRRLSGVRFVQSFELLEFKESEDRMTDIEATSALVQAAFERYIRDAPEQWMWAHRRWS
jgi:KDO2-lipid IV(A) lauroyltransferase